MSAAPAKVDMATLVQAIAAAAAVNRDGLNALMTAQGAVRAGDIPESAWPAVVGRCRALLRDAGVPESEVLNAAPAKKMRAAPSWFVAPENVAVHPQFGNVRTCRAYENLIPTEGTALLIGEAKRGKTTWLVDRLFTWPGLDGAPLRAVWLALESQGEVLRAAASFELATPGVNTVQVVPLPGAGLVLADLEALDTLAAEVCPPVADGLSPAYARLRERAHAPDVLVVDSLARALGGADENSSGNMSGAVAGLEHLRRAFSARLLVVVHHVPKGQSTPRGHGALLSGVDGCALLTAQGAGVVTVRCTAARAFEGGAVRRYRRSVAVHTDLVDDSGDLSRLVFDEIPETPAPTARAPAATPAKAAPATPAPAPAPTASPVEAPPRAAEPPPRAAEPAPAPKHPAERLKGRAAACWGVLGLAPGEAIALDDAKATCTTSPAFADVAPGRVANRWGDVVGAWRTAGLVDDTGMVRNPAT